MVRITPGELDMLRRRRAKPARPPSLRLPGGFVIFVPGALVNPLNKKPKTFGVEIRRRGEWKEKVAQALLEVTYRRGEVDPRSPKRVTLHAHVFNRFDSIDGVRAALKPIPDALQACGVIHSDDDKSGHAFDYGQVVDRAWRGVEVRVEPQR